MIDLLSSTNVYRQMPKELFFKYLNCADTLKKKFTDDIESIIWVNRLSPDTLSVWPGKILSEIAVVEIVLKRQAISQDLIEIINRETNQYTVFVIRYEEWGQIWCGNNESGNHPADKLRFDTYYQTNWQSYSALELKVEGFDLDHIYESILMQVAGKAITIENGRIPQETVAKKQIQDDRANIKNQEEAIKKLQVQIDHEKMFSKQLKLMGELKKAKEELKKISTSPLTSNENQKSEEGQAPANNIENIRAFFPNVFINMKDGAGNRFDARSF
ncbi:MAG: DUF4391 domain-containing protein [Acetobacterium woodii]|nr:DUF4391 domain-containing protein [Acetobacterium woodii]